MGKRAEVVLQIGGKSVGFVPKKSNFLWRKIMSAKELNMSEDEINRLLEMDGSDDDDDGGGGCNEEMTGGGEPEKWDELFKEFNHALIKDDKKSGLLDSVQKDIAEAEARESVKIKEENEKKKAEELKAKERSEKRIHIRAPGLNVFEQAEVNPRGGGSPFMYFSRKSLNLERDFGYAKRKWLKEKLGLSDPEVTDVLQTVWKFCLHLAPEATSAIVQDENDFAQICDYLFYAHGSTLSATTADILKKTLFSLLKNYAFTSWKLSLKHLITCLLNLGIKQIAILDQAHYNLFMKTRLDMLTEHWQETNRGPYRFVITQFPAFFQRLFENPKAFDKSKTEDESSEDDEDEYGQLIKMIEREHLKIANPGEEEDEEEQEEPMYLESLRRLIHIVADISTTFPKLCSFVAQNDRAKDEDCVETLATFNVLATVGSDKHLIMDSYFRQDLMTIYNSMLDGFSRETWAAQVVPCDIAEVLIHIGMQKNGLTEMKTWKDTQVPRIGDLQTNDHHHNMVRRLSFFPSTFRGNCLKKMVALMHLKLIVCTVDYELIPQASIKDAWKVIDENQEKFKVLSGEFYVMFSIIGLLDIIAGNEPLLDFTSSKCEYIAKTQEYLNNYSQKCLGGLAVKDTDAGKVRELVNQVTSKWNLFKSSRTNHKKQLLLDQFVTKTPRVTKSDSQKSTASSQKSTASSQSTGEEEMDLDFENWSGE